MSKGRTPRTLSVIRKHQLTPHMLRVTFGGDDLSDFPQNPNSAHIKLRLTEPEDPSIEKPVLRTYTVRHFDPVKLEMAVDFVLHESDGPASQWATNCTVGETIRIMGPGPTKLVDHDADWFLLVGDMSALPAIAANIEMLPSDARGMAIIEVINEEDQQDFATPDDLQIRWCVNSDPEQDNSVLFDAVNEFAWLDGRPSVWVAGEFSQSLAIRRFLVQERNVTRHDMYASSYWQIGQTEDGHRVSKASLRNV
ncbi:MAG: siderophore-interacting protein [Pseudomonadota bacterium]